MAKLLPILGELSGSIAGNVFSHNKGGHYARARSVPVNPNSARQQVVRGILSQVSAGWFDIIDAQRDAWTAFAALHPVLDALGQSIVLSGHQMFCRVNAAILHYGGTEIEDPPGTWQAPDQPLTISLAATAPDQLVFTYTATPLVAGVKLFAYLSPPGGPGRDPNFRTARYAGKTAAAAASPQTITSAIAIAAGQTVNAWAKLQSSNGAQGVPVKLRVVVA